MKASELRIGNLLRSAVVFSDKETSVAPIEGVNSHGVNIWGQIMIPFGKVEGVPLTEEWLIKFGFDKKEAYSWKGNGYDYQPETSKTTCQDYVIDAGDEDYFFYRIQTWSYRHDEDSEWVHDISTSIHKGSWYKKADESIPCIEINYVHQLQNLYFAITGEELTL